MKYIKITIAFLILSITTQSFAQLKGLKKTTAKTLTSNCKSSHKSLNKYLQKLEAKVDNNTVASNSFQLYLKTADKHLNVIKKKCPSDDVEEQESQFQHYESSYKLAQSETSSQDISENTNTDTSSENSGKAYFESIYRLLSKVYSNTPNGADGTVLGKHGKQAIEILNKLSDFNLDTYNDKVENEKTTENYKQSEYYISRSIKIIEDYDNFISKSKNTYINYIADLQLFGVKGDPMKELNELNEAKAFCDILLKIAPDNTTAHQWKNEVASKISSITSGLNFKSEMHKKYLGEIVFSKQPLSIGQENESDISRTFKRGDHIYATLYLGTNARDLTDGYALNNCEVKINNYLVAPGDETGVWFTTKMQDSNVVQFAIVPDESWLTQHGEPYQKHNVRTHKNIMEILLQHGDTAQIKVEVILILKGSGSAIKGNFVID